MTPEHQRPVATTEVRRPQRRLGPHTLRLLFLLCVANVHVAILGCETPEAFRQRNAGHLTGAAGVSGGGGAGAGSLGTGGQLDAAGTGGTGSAIGGSAGTGGDTGQADASSAAGSGMDGGAGSDVSGMSSDSGAAGADGSSGVAGTDGGASAGGASGSNGGAAGGGAAGSGGVAGTAGASGSSGVNHCDYKNWNASASATDAGSTIVRGIDGNLATRWSSGRSQDGTDWYQVNFGGAVKLTNITLNNTADNSSNDYPRAYAVYGSTDGVTFSGTPFGTGTGATNSTVINFAQQIVMAIKIKDTGSVIGTWWSIGELQTTCSM
jgi:hypothetical protein